MSKLPKGSSSAITLHGISQTEWSGGEGEGWCLKHLKNMNVTLVFVMLIVDFFF